MTQEQQAVKEFLSWLLTPVGAGTATWLIAGWMFKYVIASPTYKFWVTTGIALVLPTLAYVANIYLFPPASFDLVTMIYYIGVGFTVSQLEHYGSQAVRAVGKRDEAIENPPPPPVTAITMSNTGVIQPDRDTGPFPPLTPQDMGYPEGFRWAEERD